MTMSDLTYARARLEALAANFVQTAAAQKDWSLSADVIADYEQRAADLRTLLEALSTAEAELVRVREALVDHNGLLRSAFTAAQRDAIADVIGTTNYRTLADRAHEVLTKHHAITNDARKERP